MKRQSVLLACLLLGVSSLAFAQGAWPTRSITMVVPFPPGGLADLRPIARYTADPTVLAVRTDASWKTLKDFIDDAKNR